MGGGTEQDNRLLLTNKDRKITLLSISCRYTELVCLFSVQCLFSYPPHRVVGFKGSVFFKSNVITYFIVTVKKRLHL